MVSMSQMVLKYTLEIWWSLKCISFCYLEAWKAARMGVQRLTFRANLAQSGLSLMSGVWKTRSIFKETIVHLFIFNMKRVLLYRVEKWCMRKRCTSRNHKPSSTNAFHLHTISSGIIELLIRNSGKWLV